MPDAKLDKHKLILELIEKARQLPYRDKLELDEFHHQASFIIQDIFGSKSDYLHEIERIRFIPSSFYSTEADYRESWERGVNETLNFLQIMLRDPDLGPGEEPKNEVPPLPALPLEEIRTTALLAAQSFLEKETPVEALQETPTPEDPPLPEPEATHIIRTEGSPPPQENDPAFVIEITAPEKSAEPPAEEIGEEPPMASLLPGVLEKPDAPSKEENAAPPAEATPAEPTLASEEKPLVAPVGQTVSERPAQEKSPQNLSPLSADDFRMKALPQVFLVHGENDTMRNTVVAALQKMGIEPILSNSGMNAAKTVVQKFIDYPNVSFAAVILCPDDLGRRKNQPPENSRPRPRPQITFELGFLIGKLGRNRVFVLQPDDKEFELPTNYFDVIYTPFDTTGRWQFDLIRTLKACGFSVDANKLI